MRYDRQIIMEEIGKDGQEKLKNASAVVIGCGGLGSPAATYLAAAGVGKLTLVDCDTVSESNLNRQFLHWQTDIGREKVYSAREKLSRFNPETDLKVLNTAISENNADNILRGVDVVLDCVDNIGTRLIVNRACLRNNIPLVEGGVSGFYGFVMAVSRDTACLECMGYSAGNAKSPIPAFGAVAGVIGSMQCVEAVKILLGRQDVLFGKMLNYDGAHCEIDIVEVEKNPECRAHLLYREII